jgi:hypothetical protein
MPKEKATTFEKSTNGSRKRPLQEAELDRYLIDCIRGFMGKTALYAGPNETENKIAALKRTAEKDREKHDYYSITPDEEQINAAE